MLDLEIAALQLYADALQLPDATMALQLYQSILYSLAYVLLGAALIAVAVYALFLCSDIWPRKAQSKAQPPRLSAEPKRVNERVLEMPAPQSAATPQALPSTLRARKSAQGGAAD